MLRTVIGVIGLLIALALIGFAIVHPDAWPSAVMGLAIGAAVIFERDRYRKDAPGAPPPPWMETGERFIDPQSKRLVAVWTHPESGARRYVDAGERALPPA